MVADVPRGQLRSCTTRPTRTSLAPRPRQRPFSPHQESSRSPARRCHDRPADEGFSRPSSSTCTAMRPTQNRPARDARPAPARFVSIDGMRKTSSRTAGDAYRNRRSRCTAAHRDSHWTAMRPGTARKASRISATSSRPIGLDIRPLGTPASSTIASSAAMTMCRSSMCSRLEAAVQSGLGGEHDNAAASLDQTHASHRRSRHIHASRSITMSSIGVEGRRSHPHPHPQARAALRQGPVQLRVQEDVLVSMTREGKVRWPLSRCRANPPTASRRAGRAPAGTPDVLPRDQAIGELDSPMASSGCGTLGVFGRQKMTMLTTSGHAIQGMVDGLIQVAAEALAEDGHLPAAPPLASSTTPNRSRTTDSDSKANRLVLQSTHNSANSSEPAGAYSSTIALPVSL